MNTNDLRPWQIEKMIKPIQRSLRYLSTLLDRMNHVGFTPKEELYQRVQVAQSDMQAMFMTLHYLTVGMVSASRLHQAEPKGPGDFNVALA